VAHGSKLVVCNGPFGEEKPIETYGDVDVAWRIACEKRSPERIGAMVNWLAYKTVDIIKQAAWRVVAGAEGEKKNKTYGYRKDIKWSSFFFYLFYFPILPFFFIFPLL